MKRRRRHLRLFLGVVGGVVLLLLAGPFLVPVRPLEGLVEARSLADRDSQFITIPFDGTDGIELHFKEAGAGELTFVLLHGFTSNLYTWDRVVPFFASRGRVLTYDQAPFGLSERLVPGEWSGPNPYAPQARVDRLLAFLDQLRVQRAILVGNSAGGALAVEAALAHPKRVAGLILVAAALERGGAPNFVLPLLETPQIQHLGPLLARATARVDVFNRNGYVDPEQPDAASRARSAVNTRVVDWDVAFWAYNSAAARSFDVADRLGTLQQPVLLLHGDGDRIIPPAESIRAAGMVPGAEMQVLTACGHFPQDECPEAFRTAVDSWLTRAFPLKESHGAGSASGSAAACDGPRSRLLALLQSGYIGLLPPFSDLAKIRRRRRAPFLKHA